MEGQIIGKRNEGRKLRDMNAGDPWAEAPFYGVGEGSENVNGLAAGDTVAAVFHGLRVSNKNGPKANQRDYAVLETLDGEKIRLFTPGQLRYILDQLEPKTYVEITYKGKEYVEDLERECHQFDVKADEGPNN